MHRILIIDDHPIFRHAMITILGKKFPDSETLEANSISEALTLLEQDAKFDLIMLDLNMPETCGLNGLLEIRNQHPNVPVVIISAEDIISLLIGRIGPTASIKHWLVNI